MDIEFFGFEVPHRLGERVQLPFLGSNQCQQVCHPWICPRLRQQGGDLPAMMGLVVEKMRQRLPGRMFSLDSCSVGVAHGEPREISRHLERPLFNGGVEPFSLA